MSQYDESFNEDYVPLTPEEWEQARKSAESDAKRHEAELTLAEELEELDDEIPELTHKERKSIQKIVEKELLIFRARSNFNYYSN